MNAKNTVETDSMYMRKHDDFYVGHYSNLKLADYDLGHSFDFKLDDNHLCHYSIIIPTVSWRSMIWVIVSTFS